MEAVGSSPTSSILQLTGAKRAWAPHELRNRFGWYMERAAAGEEMLITRRGKPQLRLSAVARALDLAA